MPYHAGTGRPTSRVFAMLLLCASVAPAAAPEEQSPGTGLLSAMEAETARAATAFKQRTPALYYLSCGVAEVRELSICADFGAISLDSMTHERIRDIDARCGSYERDNTHPLPGEMWDYSAENCSVPLDDKPEAIRMALWRAFESKYRAAAERYAQVQAMDATKAALRDKSDDFSRAKAETLIEPGESFTVDREAWRDILKYCTLPFRDYPCIYQGKAYFNAESLTRSFVNSEGTRLQSGRTFYRVFLTVITRSEDGQDLPLYKSFFAWDPAQLPSSNELRECAIRLAETAVALRKAPMVEPYSGPAILQGEAAAVFMHEVLGHRLEGHRQKDEKESQTFRTMVGQNVMPDFMSVMFDPTIRFLGNLQLSGYYPFDEEGVAGRKVVCIENGILKAFLMSRTPIENFQESNGHGRAMPGERVVSRQSNMIVESSKPQPVAGLRQLLIEECLKQGKPFGLLFADVEGGFTMTGRFVPNAFNVMPLVVYKIYADGRPDELVRGVDIIGTPLTVLTKILAAGDDVNVFNGYCGAESGRVPVGATSPSILLGEMEVQKKEVSRASLPILPPPGAGEEARQ